MVGIRRAVLVGSRGVVRRQDHAKKDVVVLQEPRPPVTVPAGAQGAKFPGLVLVASTPKAWSLIERFEPPSLLYDAHAALLPAVSWSLSALRCPARLVAHGFDLNTAFVPRRRKSPAGRRFDRPSRPVPQIDPRLRTVRPFLDYRSRILSFFAAEAPRRGEARVTDHQRTALSGANRVRQRRPEFAVRRPRQPRRPRTSKGAALVPFGAGQVPVNMVSRNPRPCGAESRNSTCGIAGAVLLLRSVHAGA